MIHSTTPRDVFAHLLAIAMLYVSVVGFLTLIFQYINIWLPDQLSYDSFENSSSLVRASTAALIVVWPVYVYLMRMLRQDEIAQPEKHDIRIRKWLFNFTMFVSAITIIVALIIVITNFLNGELSARFYLKSATVLFVAAAVFGYYRWELKRDVAVKSRIAISMAYGVSALFVVSLVAGFFIVGTPADQRERRMDSQRVTHLQELQWQLVSYWQNNETLPAELSGLSDSISYPVVPVDPETGMAYEYRVVGDKTFELCATFARASAEQFESTNTYDGINQSWEHEAGRACFERTIDPNLYPSKEVAPMIIR